MDKHGNILVNNAEPDFINLRISAGFNAYFRQTVMILVVSLPGA